VILKLKNEIPKTHSEFSNKNLKYNDSVFSFGNRSLEQGVFLYDMYLVSAPQYHQITFLGVSTYGFSGSLLFNRKAQIIGIIQYGMDKYPKDYMDAIIKNHVESDTIVNAIKNGYKNQKHLIYAINIQYLIDKYMKGYLDED
jgi:hypothetical protein